ncbi:MAG: terminase family protein, partial [Erythrobacter sp.]
MFGQLGWLADFDPEVSARIVKALDTRELQEFDWNWPMLARTAQIAPSGDWRVWLVMAGRGFGKTRAGAEWVRLIAEENCEARIALVSASLAEARAVMVEGESGLIACSPPDRQPV